MSAKSVSSTHLSGADVAASCQPVRFEARAFVAKNLSALSLAPSRRASGSGLTLGLASLSNWLCGTSVFDTYLTRSPIRSASCVVCSPRVPLEWHYRRGDAKGPRQLSARAPPQHSLLCSSKHAWKTKPAAECMPNICQQTPHSAIQSTKNMCTETTSGRRQQQVCAAGEHASKQRAEFMASIWCFCAQMLATCI